MRAASIHTSDRILFKRCRRAWNWKSPLREHLQTKEKRLPLWFGTGWHFVLEDFHGVQAYETPVDAWYDYVNATYECYGEDYMPADFRESIALGKGMLDYYRAWLFGRDPLKTFVYNGIPQVEVNFKIRIPVSMEVLERSGFEECYYEGTIDRVIEDEYGNLWVGEYKTAKAIYKPHFLTDPQVTAYCWAAQHLYPGRTVAGCIYMQWRKDVPEEPRVLRNGRLSVAENQKTTHRHYREALIKIYGSVQKAPKENVDFLNQLAASESAEDDGFISRERIYRNLHSLQAEGVKILMETEDMLNPDIPLYPNPDRMCPNFCDLRDACVSLDDGSDWQQILTDEFMKKNEERGLDQWRPLLKHNKPPLLMETALDLHQMQM